MDPLNSQDFMKSFKYSSSASNGASYYTHHYSYLSYKALAFDTNLGKSLQLRQRKSSTPPAALLWNRYYNRVKYFMFYLFRIVCYVFVILSLSDCCFHVGGTAALALTDKAITNSTSSVTVVQLPILQALILETGKKGRKRGNTTTSTTSINNDGNRESFTSVTQSRMGKDIDTNNSIFTKNDSIKIMFTTASPSAAAAAPMFAPPSITSTLSSLLANDTEWSSLSPTLLSVAPPPSSASTSSSTPSPMGEFTMPAFQTVLVSIILFFVIIGTIVGNILVCIAVCMVRKLRRPCNYLLVSLALSDLCVAVLVMPMALLYEVLEKWNFGPVLCDIWVSFDVLCCTASILNLCAISVDRYLAITKPLEYGVKRTPRRMMLCVALVWLAAACISLPPLLILGNEHEDENGEPMCSVCQNFAYQIYATLGSFYIPLAVMLFVYYQIFRAARRIVLEEKRAQTHLQHALNGTGSPPGHTELDGNGQNRHSSYGNTSLNYSTCGGISAGGGVGSGAGGPSGGSGSSGLLGSPHQKKLRFQLAKEKKASTTLGIIMSAFTICWLPFFILALIRPFVESETTHVPQSLSSLFLWLGYANSLLNPIIYATLNRDFRKPFQEILYFRCSSLNTMMRENYYQDQYGEPPSQRVMLGDERHGARESFL